MSKRKLTSLSQSESEFDSDDMVSYFATISQQAPIAETLATIRELPLVEEDREKEFEKAIKECLSIAKKAIQRIDNVIDELNAAEKNSNECRRISKKIKD